MKVKIYGKERNIEGEIIVHILENNYIYFKNIWAGTSTQGYHDLKVPKKLFKQLDDNGNLILISRKISNYPTSDYKITTKYYQVKGKIK